MGMEVTMPETRTALVTGGNRGMGFEVVRQLAERGMTVLMGSRDLKVGEDARRQLSATERQRVAICSINVADAERTTQAVCDLERQHGPIDVLVNNAGIYPDEGAAGLDIDPEIVRSTFETNALGALQLCQLLVPGMAKRGWGRVVNVSSGYGQTKQ